MIRVIIWHGFLFALPFLMSWLWALWVQKRRPEAKVQRNTALLALAGTALVLTSLLVWRGLSGDAPDRTYVPPEFKDGQVTPGRFE